MIFEIASHLSSRGEGCGLTFVILKAIWSGHSKWISERQRDPPANFVLKEVLIGCRNWRTMRRQAEAKIIGNRREGN